MTIGKAEKGFITQFSSVEVQYGYIKQYFIPFMIAAKRPWKWLEIIVEYVRIIFKKENEFQ